jgi:hypothetical protein
MNLRVVPTKAHAAVDHVVGPTLLLAPELFGLKDDRRAALVPRLTGATEALYANLTDYELALKRVLPMRVHLALDAVGGVMLGAAPWALGTARRGTRHWLPHALVGAMEVALAITTKTEPGDRNRPDYRVRKGLRLLRRAAT